MKFITKILGGNVLYYPGCMKKFVLKDLEKNYENILRKIGVDFIKLKDKEVCCGSPVLNAGYFQTFEFLARKNYRVFKEHSVKKIITSCPACFKTFRYDYPRFLENFDIEVEHVTQTIVKAIKKGKIEKKIIKESVTYHDPCHLGRYCGIYEEPREIIKHLGFEIVEMEFNKENAFCCGGGGGVRANFPQLAEKIAEDRVEQAKKTGTKVLITTCPLCYQCLKEIGSKEGVRVKELSQIL